MSFLFTKSISINLLSDRCARNTRENRKRNRPFSHNCEMEKREGVPLDRGTKLKSISFDLYSRISKQLVSSAVSLYFSFFPPPLSLSFCVILSGQGRHVFAREANNRGIMEGIVDSRRNREAGFIITFPSKGRRVMEWIKVIPCIQT